MSTLILLDGSTPVLGKTHTILLPEAVTDVKAGDQVTLETEQFVAIGTATIVSVENAIFAKLTSPEVEENPIHPGMFDWYSAYATLLNQVKGFVQGDVVAIVKAKIDVLAAPGVALPPAAPAAEGEAA